MRSLIVFCAMVRTDQPQHCLEIRPIFLKGVFWHRRCLFRRLVEKSLQPLTIVDARLCVGERSRKRFAAKGRFAVRAESFNIFSTLPRLGLGTRFHFYLFHRSL